MNIDLIQKYDQDVRKRYPSAEIRKISEEEIKWFNDGKLVAVLKNEKRDDFYFKVF